MKTAINLLLSSFLLVSCVTNDATSTATAPKKFPQYSASRVIDTQFPPLAENPHFVDVSKRQLFATLPYFKGDTYPERLSVASFGKASIGSMKKHYYPRLGTAGKPDTFTFNNNGYGHKVVIVRNFEGDLADYFITVSDPATNTQILKVHAIYGAILGEDTTKRQWFIKSTS